MNFPWARHVQRYEYVLQQGYVDGRTVADIGCGIPIGAYALSAVAQLVYAIDPVVVELGRLVLLNSSRPERVVLIPEDLYSFVGKVDVCVAIEVFEHMDDPNRFVAHLAELCNNAFITTPLAKVTGRTRNSGHIAEYSGYDFDRIVGMEFDILDKRYQTGDLKILRGAEPNGDSISTNHVVQMLWCRNRNA